MSTTRTRRRIASLVGAIVMLLPVSLAMAQGRGDPNHPIEVTFTKWITAYPLMEGFWGGDLCEEDRLLNEEALIDGSRLLSAYSTLRGERLPMSIPSSMIVPLSGFK